MVIIVGSVQTFETRSAFGAMALRYVKGQKSATRRHILEVASQRFRENGIAAAGLATVMSDAGLTNGAFYAHFQSKEHLVREAVVAAIADQIAQSASRLESVGLESAFRAYLNPAHRDHPSQGCASAALLAEIARRPRETREAYTEQLEASIDMIARHLAPMTASEARSRAMAINALLIGTLQIARATANDHLSLEILESGVQGALALSRIG